MKKHFSGLGTWAMLFILSCGTSPARKDSPSVTGLLSFDEAMIRAAAAVEAKVQGGTEITIAQIDSPLSDLSDFLNDELSGRFNSSGKLTVLAQGQALQGVDTEHQFQMTGLVSDESAVGIGHYLGAKVVITGSFDRFANFSQFRLRAIEVRTARPLTIYSALIRNDDGLLASVAAPLESVKAPVITEAALDALNRGKDLCAERMPDEAIHAFDRALAINGALSEGYFYRAYAYYLKGDLDHAITDWSAAIMIDPSHAIALVNRGYAYADKGDFDRAIADYNAALEINPNLAGALIRRGDAYADKNDRDRAITDYTAALRINPNDADALEGRGTAYANKGYLNRAIVDWEAALRINPNHAAARRNLERARQQRDQ